jgi:hypothetical protein
MQEAVSSRPQASSEDWVEVCLLSVFNESGLANWSKLTSMLPGRAVLCG